MKSTVKMARLSLILVPLTFSLGCSHLAVDKSGTGAALTQQLSEVSQGPGSGITRYPVRMREIRSD